MSDIDNLLSENTKLQSLVLGQQFYINQLEYELNKKSNLNWNEIESINLLQYKKILRKYGLDYLSLVDSIQDFNRFSTLHSWYKHMGKFDILYPLLMEGEELRYEFDPKLTDENQKNFHWRFILEKNIRKYGICFHGKYYEIGEDLIEFMKKYPIYVNNQIGSHAISSPRSFFEISAQKICQKFLNDLLNIKNNSK